MKKVDILASPEAGKFIEQFGPTTPRRKSEFIQTLLELIWQFCLQVDEEAAKSKAEIGAAKLGRRGGLKGGPERNRRLSPARRREIATKAARARWDKPNDEQVR